MERKVERNRLIAEAYRTATIAELATRFEMSASNVYRILENEDALLDYETKRERCATANRKRAADPINRAKVSLGTAAWWARKTGGNGPLTCTQAGVLPVYGCRLSETEAA